MALSYRFYLLAMAFAAIPTIGAQATTFFDVRGYGAQGNGTTLDTVSFEKAIEAASSAGGGTVLVPAGRYLTGTIRLRDNITLSIDSGATLVGTKDLAQYQSSNGADEWYKALILAQGAHNVAVVGGGAVDGNRIFNPKGEEHIRGPHAILFYDCTRVSVRDIQVKDAGNYAVILRSVEGIDIEGLTVHGGWDGINMHDVRNATVSNCRLFTGDDSLAGAYWENVTVSNCILNSACNPIRVGGRNVLITNCVMYGPGESEHGTSLRYATEAGFQILPQNSRAKNKYVKPGPVDNMVLANNTMIRVRTPVYVAYSADAPYSGNNLGVKSIVVENLTVLDAGRTPFYISAPPDNPAKSIVLRNVRMTFTGGGSETQAEGQGFSPYSTLQSYAVYGRNVEHLELHDVRADYVEPDTRPAIFGENIGTLELDRFQAKRDPAGEPFLELAGIGRVIVDGKQAAASAARVDGLEVPSKLIAGTPFPVAALVTATGNEGLASVPLAICGETLPRSVWLNAGEKARIFFVNVRCKQTGELSAEAGEVRKPLAVAPKPEGASPSPPFRTFQNVTSELRQAGDSFYIRAAGDYTVMEYCDQYGAIYQPRALGENGTVIVKVENPDLRANWLGRAGIMVRSDATQPGRAAGYAILSSSPADGSYLEWDSSGKGRLDRHTELDGYTVWPHWLKLERHSNHFIGSESDDGIHWRNIGEADVPGASGSLDAGMFAFRSSARFENFRIQGAETH
ncbi:MAG: right-handed parallel beta-helix repeat-containing protein [Acidobacteriaceae bacterium]|nr:right-handed parallel beta-helix repeat-containing protein [Acidobacteriaceae bacterium]